MNEWRVNSACACRGLIYCPLTIRHVTIPIRLLNVCMYVWLMYTHTHTVYCNRFHLKNLKIQSDDVDVFQQQAIKSRVSKKFITYCFDCAVFTSMYSLHTVHAYQAHTVCAALNIIAFDVHNYRYCYCYARLFVSVYAWMCVSFQFAIAILKRFEYHYKNMLLSLSFDNIHRALSFPLM